MLLKKIFLESDSIKDPFTRFLRHCKNLSDFHKMVEAMVKTLRNASNEEKDPDLLLVWTLMLVAVFVCLCFATSEIDT